MAQTKNNNKPRNNDMEEYHGILDPLIRHLGLKDHAKSSYNNNKINTVKSLSAVSKHARTASLVALRDHADHKISDLEDIRNVVRVVFDPDFMNLFIGSLEHSTKLYNAALWYKILLRSTHGASKVYTTQHEGSAGIGLGSYSVPMADSIIAFLVLNQQNPEKALKGSFSERPDTYGEAYGNALNQLIACLQDAAARDAPWEDISRGSLPDVVVDGMSNMCTLIEATLYPEVVLPSNFSRHLDDEMDHKKVLSGLSKAYRPIAIFEAARTIHFFPTFYAKTDLTTIKDLHKLFLLSPLTMRNMKDLYKLGQAMTDFGRNDKRMDHKITMEEAVRIKHLTASDKKKHKFFLDPKFSFFRSKSHYAMDDITSRAIDVHLTKMVSLLNLAFGVFCPSYDVITSFKMQTMSHEIALLIYAVIASDGGHIIHVQHAWTVLMKKMFDIKSPKKDDDQPLPPNWAHFELDFNKVWVTSLHKQLMQNSHKTFHMVPAYTEPEALGRLYRLKFEQDGPQLVQYLRNVISHQKREVRRVLYHKRLPYYQNMFTAYSMMVSFYIIRAVLKQIMKARERSLPRLTGLDLLNYRDIEWTELKSVCSEVKKLWNEAQLNLDDTSLNILVS
jgi:hypothetical protein